MGKASQGSGWKFQKYLSCHHLAEIKMCSTWSRFGLWYVESLIHFVGVMRNFGAPNTVAPNFSEKNIAFPQLQIAFPIFATSTWYIILTLNASRRNYDLHLSKKERRLQTWQTKTILLDPLRTCGDTRYNYDKPATHTFELEYPNNPCMVYFPTFTIKISQMWVNIPYIDNMG